MTAGDAVAGEALFKSNCGACHKLYKPMTGPALFNVVEKYDGDYEWLYKWIKNSTALIKSGDARAVKVYEENGKKVMNSFPALTNADIDNILAYTNTPQPEITGVTPAEGSSWSRRWSFKQHYSRSSCASIYFACCGVVSRK